MTKWLFAEVSQFLIILGVYSLFPLPWWEGVRGRGKEISFAVMI